MVTTLLTWLLTSAGIGTTLLFSILVTAFALILRTHIVAHIDR